MEQAVGLNEQRKIKTQLVGTQVSTTSAPEVLIKKDDPSKLSVLPHVNIPPGTVLSRPKL
ncbi:hypothetical protein ACFTQL_12990 [Peribacillus butanolivorans]|uniref:hypothetical protein n=1 Tax=Peribacillus butanolivorans TaxID=421767 RepID=UPI00362564CD